MKAELFIGLRYLWNTRRTRFLSVITLISVLGIAIGVAAIISVQSIMDGLQNKMKAAVLGAKTHIRIEHEAGTVSDYENAIAKISDNTEFYGVTPIISRDVIVSFGSELTGAVVNGIDIASAGSALKLPEQITKGSLKCVENPADCPEIVEKREALDNFLRKPGAGEKRYGDMPGIAIGSEMAKYYALDIGDKIKIISPTGGKLNSLGLPTPLVKTFIVSAVFFTTYYEYDFSYAYITLDAAKEFFSTGGAVDHIGVRLKDVYAIEPAENFIRSKLGDGFKTKNWRDMNKPLFSALEMEKVLWFLILGFIALVASFNVISALVMLVIGKKSEIAVLRAMGFTSRSVMKIFMFDGLTIGMIGTTLGTILGVAASCLLNGLPLGDAQDVYYIETLPVDLAPSTLVIAIAGSLLLSLAATIYPGLRAANLKPVDALRHE
ncbi:ABC transporter permease [bacterium]|nr:ABC transporter permease [bacterium]